MSQMSANGTPPPSRLTQTAIMACSYRTAPTRCEDTVRFSHKPKTISLAPFQMSRCRSELRLEDVIGSHSRQVHSCSGNLLRLTPSTGGSPPKDLVEMRRKDPAKFRMIARLKCMRRDHALGEVRRRFETVHCIR